MPAEQPNQPVARAFIFARGGSKGIPRKNVQLLGDKPLIAHAIHSALDCAQLGRVTVSTDDPEIGEVARVHGAQVPFVRPAELAGDTSSELHAWRHAIDWTEHNEGPFDIFVSLPATSPFRTVEDIDKCLALLRANPALDIVVTVKKAERSPYFNMVKCDSDGYASLVIAPTVPGTVTRRQDAPEVFDMTTVAYVARTHFVKRCNNLFEGRVGVVEIPVERAMDIDTPYDLRLARLLFDDGQTSSN
jgi:N-acylneuraminate cytidylyltransferase